MNTQLELLFKRLRGPEFNLLREFLKEGMTQRMERLALTKDEIDIYRLQGEIKAIRELLGLLTEEVAKRQR